MRGSLSLARPLFIMCSCIVREPPFIAWQCCSAFLVHSQSIIFCVATLKWGAAMTSLLHRHRLCLTPSNASSLGLLLRRSFAHDVSDPSEKAAKKVQEGAKKVSQKRDDAKAAAKSAGQQSKSAAEKIKHQAEKEFNTARDMVKDIPQNTKEAAKGVKEVAVDAGKAVKRDAEKVAEKVGIKEKKKTRD